jgi:quercetin dioxygenase-like cupin family protein
LFDHSNPNQQLTLSYHQYSNNENGLLQDRRHGGTGLRREVSDLHLSSQCQSQTLTQFPQRQSSPFPILEIVYKYKLLNTPDKTILGLKVTFPPGACTPPHTHHGAAIAVHILSGTVLNKMNDEPMTIKKAGESFFEAPGCRHRISDNASLTEEASLLATMVLETEIVEAALETAGAFGLVDIDEEYREAVMERVAGM